MGGTMKRALVGGVGVAAMMATAPAQAQYRYDRYDRDDGISAGEIIAGAVIIGGIAAAVGAIANGGRDPDRYYTRGYDYDPYDGYDRRYRDPRYRGYYPQRLTARQAVERCVQAAENRGNRRFGRTDVTEIRDVDRNRYGFRVRGNLVVQDGYDRRGNGYGYGYGRRGRYDPYGYGGYGGYGGVDRGRFTCDVGYDGRARIDFDGIRR